MIRFHPSRTDWEQLRTLWEQNPVPFAFPILTAIKLREDQGFAEITP
jgi:hypothetical protein